MSLSAYAGVLRGVSLLAICVLAFSIRLFSVVKYESVIHEFDPYFNYRVTQYLTKEGFYSMWNWFDDRTWYPLGRVVGGTLYPGLIWTAGIMYKVLHALNIPINVQEVCVFTAPLFSAFSTLAAYGLVAEVRGASAGTLAAAFVGVVPSYISRSVAGSYDLEAVAIFALLMVFYLFVKTLNTGSVAWALALCAAYFYMALSWGGYTFIINLLPIYCLVSVASGRLTSRLYIAFAPLVAIGTLLAASIPVIGFNAVTTSEHFGAFLAFAVLHGALGLQYIRRLLPERDFRAAAALVVTSGAVAGAAIAAVVAAKMLASPTFGWTGRSLSLLDPTYAARYIPIIASVSEHQPPTWNAYFMDIQAMVVLMPLGLVLCFLPLSDASLFLALYGVTAVYFSGVMVRLMLVLAPASCCLGALAADALFAAAARGVFPRPDALAQGVPSPRAGPPKASRSDKRPRGVLAAAAAARRAAAAHTALPRDVAALVLVSLAAVFLFYTAHAVWVSAEMYSAPSIVLQTRAPDGSIRHFDDFREAYAWLRSNTPYDTKVAAWWDYGYQTTAMADRTVIVDNNTWNNTHIATVGRAMASPERRAWRIFRSLDVDYVFVVFGGYIGYPSDDINKFLWMVRIAQGEFADIKERDFLGPRGYTVDSTAPPALLDSLMYKLSYHGFADAGEVALGRRGFDRVRNTIIGKQNIKLKHFEEVFTSEHWMVRIYRVLPPVSREPKMANPLRVRDLPRSKRSPRTMSGAP